jgi:hypothetical protein
MKVPTERITATPGRTYPGVVCKGCSTGIAMGGNVAGLPDSFDLTCPRCGRTETYQKGEIQTLEAHRRH